MQWYLDNSIWLSCIESVVLYGLLIWWQKGNAERKQLTKEPTQQQRLFELVMERMNKSEWKRTYASSTLHCIVSEEEPRINIHSLGDSTSVEIDGVDLREFLSERQRSIIGKQAEQILTSLEVVDNRLQTALAKLDSKGERDELGRNS